MSTSKRRRFATTLRPELEALEPRQFLSSVLPSADAVSGLTPYAAVPGPSLAAPAVLTGTSIYAQTGQAFRAVIGTVRLLDALSTGYSLKGSIDWGDGTAASNATFVPQSKGSISVLGSHTYKAAGSDAITINVIAVPPPGSLARARLIGTIYSKAQVFAPDGGVTLNQAAGVAFEASVGSFRSTLPVARMTATIDWGDGTKSEAKIIQLPTANPLAGGTFAVVGGHTYAAVGSYHLQISVLSPPPSSTDGPTFLVAQIDSVIDVLPVSPTATA